MFPVRRNSDTTEKGMSVMSVKKISEAILGVGVDDTTIDLFES